MGFVEKRGERRWRARYRDSEGKERSRTFDTRGEASEFLKLVVADIARGEWIDPRATRTAVSSVAAMWLSSKVDLKPKTLAGYESMLNARILPRWGTVAVADVSRKAVQDWVGQLIDDGLSASLIRQCKILFSGVMAMAVDERLIRENPVAKVKVPRPKPRKPVFLTADQVQILVGSAESLHKPLGTHLLLMAYTGLRFGEAAALRRSSVDLLGKRLLVTENLVEVHGKLVLGTPKTGANRSIPLPAFLVERLRAHLEEEVEAAPRALLFTSSTGTALRYSNWRRNQFNKARESAGLPVELTPHHLRHTAAALLISQGSHPKAVQQILGHSSIQVTFDIYGHLFDADLDVVAGRLHETYEVALAASARPGGAIPRIGLNAPIGKTP